jgi:hypothetical protein
MIHGGRVRTKTTGILTGAGISMRSNTLHTCSSFGKLGRSFEECCKQIKLKGLPGRMLGHSSMRCLVLPGTILRGRHHESVMSIVMGDFATLTDEQALLHKRDLLFFHLQCPRSAAGLLSPLASP